MRQLLRSQFKAVCNQFDRNSDEAIEISLSQVMQHMRPPCVSPFLTMSSHFTHIRQKKVSSPRIGPLKTLHGQVINDSASVANVLANAFSSVYSVVATNNPEPHQSTVGRISEVSISNDQEETIFLKP